MATIKSVYNHIYLYYTIILQSIILSITDPSALPDEIFGSIRSDGKLSGDNLQIFPGKWYYKRKKKIKVVLPLLSSKIERKSFLKEKNI